MMTSNFDGQGFKKYFSKQILVLTRPNEFGSMTARKKRYKSNQIENLP